MQMVSLAATPAAFLLPSPSTHVTAGKLALISILVTIFFLFTSGFNIPGGGTTFIDWAEAIVHGTTLPAYIAAREVGFPLLYILGGFTWLHSFIGIILIYAAFAVLIPVLVYWSLMRASQTIAFYVGIACIISLSPYTYIKFFFHDQAYIFFNLLAVALLMEFLWSGQFRLLYFFTLAALAASFTRTAGNLLYPVLLTIAYVAVRGRFRHYLGCGLIFILVTGAYQWHRYEIFDMRNQPSILSGKGGQIFYSTYLYLGDFGYRLSPDLGPNTKRLLEELRRDLQSGVRQSALIQQALSDDPQEFLEQHVYAYTPEELFKKICTQPNEEYWSILMFIDHQNDQFYFDIAQEIIRSYPWYVIQYSTRNLWHAVFDPGYATTRYNTLGYIKTGLDFVPGMHGWGVRSADSVTEYGQRAEREMEYWPLKSKPRIVQQIFIDVENFWIVHFSEYVWITSLLIVTAWIGAFLGVLCWAVPGTRFDRALVSVGVNKLIAPIIAVSALLLYEDLATAMFSQPVYRYFHMTEPLRLVIAGFGVAFLTGALSSSWQAYVAASAPVPSRPSRKDVFSAIQKYDLIEGYFGRRRAQWILLLVVVNATLFAWWAYSMIAHT
jgi:hypothetical protein